MELSAEMDVQFAKGLNGAKVNVQLMCVLIYHRPSPTEGDAFTGLCDHRFVSFRRDWVSRSSSPSAVEAVLVTLCYTSPHGYFRINIEVTQSPPCREKHR